MASLTVLVAPRGPATGVLDVLRDWSALGLVGPFVWVEADTVIDRRVPALAVIGGQVDGRANLDQLVATGTRFDRFRVCVLVPLTAGAQQVSSQVEQQVAGVVSAAGGRKPMTLIRVLLVGAGAPDEGVTLAQMGWHNVVLAPEDSEAPDRGPVSLDATEDLVTIGQHAAAGIAGVAALWAEADQTPFDDLTVLPGENLRLVRSYYRRLQTRALENELRARITSTQRGLPLPVLNGMPALPVENVELATSKMADALWKRHPEVLKGPRAPAPAKRPQQSVSAGQVLRMFFSFLGAAIKNAPANWYRGVVNTVSSGAARGVHNAVFGSVPVAYRTVVNGRTDTGVPASWVQLGEATGQVAQALSGPGHEPVHHSRPDLSRLWQEFVYGGLTLADGGARVEGMDFAEIGINRGIVRAPVDIAPDRTTDFDGVTGNIQAAVGSPRIPVRDVLATEDLANRLHHATTDPHVALDAGRALERLQAWRTRYRATYVVQVGNYLGRSLTDLGREIGGILGRLQQAAGSEDIEQAEQNRQRKLARLQKFLLIALLVALVVVVVLYVSAVLVLLWAAILAVALILGWVIGSVVAFLRGQRALFQEMHRREEATGEAEADSRNLPQALRDFRRVSDAYHQYLAWSEVLGTVLAAPFGAAPTATDDISRLNSGLPLSARVGVAEIDEGAVGEAAVMIRQDFLRYGWLGDPWEATLAGAARMLGPEAHALRENPRLLYGQQAIGPESQLREWASRLAAAGPSPAGGDQLWAAVITHLRSRRTDLLGPLLGQVRVPRRDGSINQAEFMSGVDREHRAAYSEYFDGTILTAPSRTAGHNETVEPHVAFTATDGLGRVAVLTQMTDGLPIYEFDFGAGAEQTDDDAFTLPVEPDIYRSSWAVGRDDDEPEAPTVLPGGGFTF